MKGLLLKWTGGRVAFIDFNRFYKRFERKFQDFKFKQNDDI